MEPIETQEIILRITRLLKEKHISAARMSRDLGFSSGLFSQWKQGQQTPSPEKLLKMADYFGVTTDYLLGHDPADGASDLRRAIMRGLDGLEEPALERVLDYVRFTAEQQEKARLPHHTAPFPDF
jgi:transcriptional regulator with XRE-family HTH domain